MVQGEAERSLGLLLHITQLRPYDHFVTRLPGFYFIQADPTLVKIRRLEPFFRFSFEENGAANARSIARYFRVRRSRGQNKTRLLRGGDRGPLRYGNQLPCDEFSKTWPTWKWAAGETEEQALEAFWARIRHHQSIGVRTLLLPHDYDIVRKRNVRNCGTGFSGGRSASRSDKRKAKYFKTKDNRWNKDKNCTRQKPFHGRARPPFPRMFAGQIPFGASGVTPGHDARAQLARSVFCRVRELWTATSSCQSRTERNH